MKTWTTSSGRVKGMPEGYEWIWFAVFVAVLTLITAIPTWFVAGWFGATGDTRLVIASQAPSVGILIVWGLALIFPVRAYNTGTSSE